MQTRRTTSVFGRFWRGRVFGRVRSVGRFAVVGRHDVTVATAAIAIVHRVVVQSVDKRRWRLNDRVFTIFPRSDVLDHGDVFRLIEVETLRRTRRGQRRRRKRSGRAAALGQLVHDEARPVGRARRLRSVRFGGRRFVAEQPERGRRGIVRGDGHALVRTELSGQFARGQETVAGRRFRAGEGGRRRSQGAPAVGRRGFFRQHPVRQPVRGKRALRGPRLTAAIRRARRTAAAALRVREPRVLRLVAAVARAAGRHAPALRRRGRLPAPRVLVLLQVPDDVVVVVVVQRGEPHLAPGPLEVGHVGFAHWT